MAEIFQIPGKIVTGLGAVTKIKELKEINDKKSALIITDQVRIDKELEEQLFDDLEKKGINLWHYNITAQSVTESAVNKGMDLGKNNSADLVISVGGKVAIKIGKLISILLSNGGKIEDYTRSGTLTNGAVPFIAIATTASAGSAITNCACFNDSTNCQRWCIADSALLPQVSVLDPGVTKWLSPKEIAHDGIVSLSYAVEALASDTATPVTDACAIEAASSLMRWLPEAYSKASSIEAREQMMYAQQLVSMARSNTRASALCKVAGQLEVQAHINSANVISAMLPLLIELYEEVIPDKILKLNTVLNRSGAPHFDNIESDRVSDKFREIVSMLDLPSQLSFLGLEPDRLEDVIKTLTDSSLPGNSENPVDQALLDLLRKAL